MPAARPEFWLPKLRRNRERDVENAQKLRAQGWRVLTVWECELRDQGGLLKRLRRHFGFTPLR